MPLIIVSLIERLRYLGIFMGAFIEGPAVGLFVGFLARTGALNLFWAYLAHVVGDLSADFFYYFIGYQGQKGFFKKFNISKRNLIRAERMKKFFHQHPRKIIILGKLTHIVGLPVLIGAGIAHYPWLKFLLFDFIATLIKSAILIFIGFYLTSLWMKINHVISYIGLISTFSIVIVFIYLLIKLYNRGKEL